MIWKERPIPAAVIASGLKPGDRAAAEEDLALVRHEHPGDQVEGGGLAGAVRADQRVQAAVAHQDVDALHGLDAAEALGDAARLKDRLRGMIGGLEEGRQRLVRERAAGHRGFFLDRLAERRQEPLRNPDEAGRREHDEADEEDAEIEQPARRPDRQELAKQDVEQRPERRPEEAPHAADHHHGDELAREGDGERLGRGEAVVEHREHAGDADDRRRDHEAEELVAVRRVAEKAGALLVLADRDEDAAGRRAVEAPEQEGDDEPDGGNDPVVDRVALEVQAEHGRARDAAETALAAGELRPAIADREQERGQRQRQEREIDAAPAQDQRAGERCRDGDEDEREQRRQDELPGTSISALSAAA